MSKTPQEILMKHAGDILTVNNIGTFYFTQAMNEYADQRVSEALNEYKEKLKGIVESVRTETDSKGRENACKEILELLSTT